MFTGRARLAFLEEIRGVVLTDCSRGILGCGEFTVFSSVIGCGDVVTESRDSAGAEHGGSFGYDRADAVDDLAIVDDGADLGIRDT